MKPTSTLKMQQGVIVLEGLIAILIFSIGILALMGMQAASISATTSAKYRSDASYLADQIISRIWSAGNNPVVTPINPTPVRAMAAFACNPCTNSSGGNTTTQSWVTEVATLLPGAGAGGLNWPTIAINGNQATVTVFWKAPNETTAHNFITVATIASNK